MIKKYSKYLFSFLILIFIVVKYEWTDVFDALLSQPPWIFFILIIIVSAQLFINALIKSKMLKIFKFHLPLKQIFKMMFIGSYYGIIMPQTIGGDYYYIYYFGKKFNDYSRIFSGIFLIRIIGLMVFTILVMFTISISGKAIFNNLKFNSINIKNIIFILAGIIVLIICITYYFRKFFEKAFMKFRDRFSGIRKDVFDNYSILILIFILTLLFYGVSIGGRVLLGKIIGIELSMKELMLIIMVVNFLIMLPISIGGIGVREGGYIALMGLLGVNSTQALSLSVLDFSIYLIAIIVGGIFSVSSKADIKLEESEIRKEKSEKSIKESRGSDLR